MCVSKSATGGGWRGEWRYNRVLGKILGPCKKWILWDGTAGDDADMDLASLTTFVTDQTLQSSILILWQVPERDVASPHKIVVDVGGGGEMTLIEDQKVEYRPWRVGTIIQ